VRPFIFGRKSKLHKSKGYKLYKQAKMEPEIQLMVIGQNGDKSEQEAKLSLG